MIEARGPVFVAGCPRSGTSALGWSIAASEYYWTSVETHFFYGLLAEGGRNKLYDAYMSSDHQGSWLNEHAVSYNEFVASIGSGLNALMLSRSDQVQWVDNSPENLLVADDLTMMFPGCVIIHVIRDPREVCASMLLSGFHRESWSRDLDEAIMTWKHYAAAGQALKARHPDRVIEVSHSSMLQQPDEVANLLATFLNIPDGNAIAHFLRSERINSSYDATSRLAEPGIEMVSGSKEQRRVFLAENGDYILSQAQPYAGSFGFGDSADS